MNRIKIEKNIKNSSFRDNEDMPVIEYLDSLDKDVEYSMLEVGSGECRFVKKIKQLYPNIKITCVEINPNLADIAKSLGCEVVNENVLNVHLGKKYDIVHCSHVIEHFGYPQIADVLDFLVDSVVLNGVLIIRSPLMWSCFYNDLDHVRPYPPASILSYFTMKQQQRIGKGSIDVKSIWYRTSPRKLEHLEKWHFLYVVKPFRRILNRLIDKINNYLLRSWEKYRYPSSVPNGYVLIASVR